MKYVDRDFIIEAFRYNGEKINQENPDTPDWVKQAFNQSDDNRLYYSFGGLWLKNERDTMDKLVQEGDFILKFSTGFMEAYDEEAFKSNYVAIVKD